MTKTIDPAHLINNYYIDEIMNKNVFIAYSASVYKRCLRNKFCSS